MGFTARLSLAASSCRLLYDKSTWTKWASRDKTKAANWAPMPKPPVVTEVVKTASEAPSEWYYTTTQPKDHWFSDSFSRTVGRKESRDLEPKGTPNAIVNTKWSSSDIWMVKDVEVDSTNLADLQWLIHHDEDTEVYVNGNLLQVFPAIRLNTKSVLCQPRRRLFQTWKKQNCSPLPSDSRRSIHRRWAGHCQKSE